MKRPQKYADPEKKIIKDAMDPTGIHFLARNNEGELVACMRVNDVGACDIGDYFELYRFDDVPEDRRALTTIGTRLMSLNAVRKTPAALGLFFSSCRYALNNGIRYCRLDCNDYLVKHFEAVGYKSLFNVTHEEYGDVVVLEIDLADVSYLEKIGSPLAALCIRARDTGSAGDPATPFA